MSTTLDRSSVGPAPKAAAVAAFCCLALLLGGCSRLETEYGKSTGRSGKTSLNGFGGLRALYEWNEWETRSISRVGPRLDKLETIVWTPSVNLPLDSEVTEWFDQWLGRDGKTLVYVVYDGGSEAAYWRQAARFADPLQRLEYRRRAARAEIEQLQTFLQQPLPEGNGWFQLDKLSYPQPIDRLTGPWAPGAAATDGAAEDDRATSLMARYAIEQYDGSKKPVAGGAAAAAFTPWMEVDEPSEVTTELQPLLKTEAGTPLVTRIESPQWGQSQVFVVSAGSLLTNFGMTEPLGRSLAESIVTASGPPAQAGFLSSGGMGVGVSSSIDAPSKSGMELLTVWPLSLVTIHAALLGLVVCLILMPIFGRPQNPRRHSQTDFAAHLDAVAGLLARTGGDDYARGRISDYMRRVRGETTGPWILPEPHDAPLARPAKSAAPSDQGPVVPAAGPADQTAAQASPDSEPLPDSAAPATPLDAKPLAPGDDR